MFSDLIPDPSSFLLSAFVGLVATVALGLVACVRLAETDPDARRRSTRRAIAVLAGWLAVPGVLAALGALHFDTLPPPPMVLVGAMTVPTVLLARSAFGRKLALALPLWLLIGFNAFRLPLELIMHRAYSEGVMPVQMSFSGWNFDIASGVLAIIAGALAFGGRLPAALAWAYNGLGFALLATIVGIAILSMPTPLRAFTNDPPNVWIATFPFVWLPTFLVQVALLGHLLIARRLLAEGAGATQRPEALDRG